MEIQMQACFRPGQNVDVRDHVNKWVNGEILYIKNKQIYIHYSGWSYKYDEIIAADSDRILEQWEPNKQMQLFNRVDAYHPIGGWLEARIIEIEQQYDPNLKRSKTKRVKVHFFNYHNKYDRWVDPQDNNAMSIIGARSKAYGLGKCRGKNKSNSLTLSELTKKVLQLKLGQMLKQLSEQNLTMKVVKGDGNCLFRSISDQLYGTEEHFRQIRQICMKYILSEKIFFQDFILEDIEDYVERKSTDGEWGDDVEIEALSQIYGRPIEIYATSAKPIRTFHEDRERQIEPLRLAYIGACHYNSIKPSDQLEKTLMDQTFGQYENVFFTTYHNFQRQQNQMAQYRALFANTNNLNDAVEERIQAENRKQEDNKQQNLAQFDNIELNNALAASETEQILEQIEKSEIKQLEKKYEQENLLAEIKKIEEEEMRIAKELSKINEKENQNFERPYWYGGLLSQGFTEAQILFAIQVKGYDPDGVQNFLLENLDM